MAEKDDGREKRASKRTIPGPLERAAAAAQKSGPTREAREPEQIRVPDPLRAEIWDPAIRRLEGAADFVYTCRASACTEIATVEISFHAHANPERTRSDRFKLLYCDTHGRQLAQEMGLRFPEPAAAAGGDQVEAERDPEALRKAEEKLDSASA